MTRSRIGLHSVALTVMLLLAGSLATASNAKDLPASLSLGQYQAGADTGIEATIQTASRARCNLGVRADGAAEKFRRLNATRAGRIAVRWSVASTAPTATWRFEARCRRGERRGGSEATAFVFTERKRGKRLVVGHSTAEVRTGDPTVIPPPKRYRGAKARPARVAGASAGNPFPPGQCTWYAFQRRPDLGGAVYGNAHTWDETARRGGFPISSIPARGTIAVWDPGEKGAHGAGHVAYVERVLSGNRIEISEYNWKPFSFGKRIESVGGLAFIYRRGQKPGAPISLPKFGVRKLDDQVPRDGLVRLSPGESIEKRGFNLRFVVPWRKEFVLRPNTPINVNRFSSAKGDWAAVRAPNDAAVGYYRTTISVPKNTPNGDYLLRWNVVNAKTGQRSKAQPSLRVIVTRPSPEVPAEKAAGDMLGLFRPSAAPPTWYFRYFLTSGADTLSFSFANPEDRPVLGDWNGDGIDTVGVFRPSNATWYLKNTNAAGAPDVTFPYAVSGDIPVAGDWNGDGTDTVGVFRPSNATWYLKNTNAAGAQDVVFSFALGSDLPVVGDWDGDGSDGVGVFRPGNARWYLRNSLSSGGNEVPSFAFALGSDRPVAGDWNGDGFDTVGVYRPGNATWYLRNALSDGAADVSAAFGASDDLPLVGRLIPPP